MARVCFPMVLLALLSACAAEQNMPSASTQQESLVSHAKGVLACTGLPLGGQKCVLEDPKAQTPPSPGNEKA